MAETTKGEPRGKNPRGLGRGLAALFGEQPAESSAVAAVLGIGGAAAASQRQVPVEHIHPNLQQPRQHYDEAALEALAASIREQGVLQPLVVRPHPDKSGEFQIVAGERRWRAAQKCGLHEIPIVIRELDEVEVLEIGIIENVQRSDLNPIEEAVGYQQLMSKFGR